MPKAFFYRIQCNGDKVQLMRDRSVLEESGSEIINRLHLGMNFTRQEGCRCVLKNSFTIMAVRYSWIKEMVIPAKERWNQDKIEKVYIRLIERPGGKIRKIEEEIKDKLKIKKDESIRNPILGTDDEIIILPKIGWGDFLALYNREDGLFGNRFDESSLYNKNAAGVTTQICDKLDERSEFMAKMVIEREQNEEKANNREIFERQISKLKDKLDKIKEEGHCINELYIILNTLPKYSGEMFNDYVFFPLLKVLDTLLDLMIQQMSKWSKRLDKEPFYDFLTGFCFYTQNTMLTDRYTAQMLGFNVKIYDIPVKLNAFYNAFMYSVACVLKMQSKDEPEVKELSYDFIVMPGMADMVNVIELYKGVSDKQRLMKAEIPEYSFYNVSDMLMILAHETAHYVGREMRNREERTEIIISSYAHIYIKYVEHYARLSGCEDGAWQESKGRLINLIYRFLLLECDETFLEEKYTDQEQIFKEFYDSALEQESSSKEKAERNRKNIDYFAELLSEIHNVMIRINKDNLESVFFADLMSILILQMGVKEYVSGIIECAEYQNMEAEVLLCTDAVLRIAAVLGCILETEQSLRNGTLEKLSLYDERVFTNWRQELREGRGNDKWQQVAGEALRLWYESTCGQAGKEYQDNIYCALIYDDVILKKLFQQLSGEYEQSGEDQIREMVIFIEAYKWELLQQMAKEGNNNGNSGMI